MVLTATTEQDNYVRIRVQAKTAHIFHRWLLRTYLRITTNCDQFPLGLGRSQRQALNRVLPDILDHFESFPSRCHLAKPVQPLVLNDT
jgi:hypothetical protein